MLRLSDKRSCAVSYSPHRTLWLSRADGDSVGPDNRHLQNDARNRFRSAQARSHSPVGLDTGEADRRESHAFRQKEFTYRSGALRAVTAGSVSEAFRPRFPSPVATASCWTATLRSSCAIAREHVQGQPSAKSPLKPRVMSLIMEGVARRRQSSVGP